MEYIAFFLENDPNPSLFGGKGANLIKLTKIIANVPSGFIVNVCSYDRFLKESEYADQLRKLLSKEFKPSETLQISAEIQDLMQKSTFPKGIREELERAYKKILEIEEKDISFAVRSSATVEDSSRFSFAGQADTFLYNNTLEEIIISLKKCWISLFSPRTMLYFLHMKKKGFKLSLLEVKMAVVIQKMINSDCAGVLFTVNVVNNDKNQMIINSSWGLGGPIADNSITPDTIILNKQKFEIVKTIIGKKEQKSVRNPEGLGTMMVDVNQDLRKICSLTEAQLRAIHGLGLKIEKAMGCPQDIELAIENNVLYILQTRPITTLKT